MYKEKGYPFALPTSHYGIVKVRDAHLGHSTNTEGVAAHMPVEPGGLGTRSTESRGKRGHTACLRYAALRNMRCEIFGGGEGEKMGSNQGGGVGRGPIWSNRCA